mmetsp:Transcript_19919/g.37500  ORF Transcript_19919/g.37500 Transcript_19919/m.37500 type:complete len:474 (-) Transcript_19919:168-1589(-)
MNFNRALQLLVGAMAATTATSFAPTKLAVSSSSPSHLVQAAATETYTTAYDQQPIVDIPPMPLSCSIIPSCDTETLDAEMDSFADPNDKRYGASDWFHNIRSLPNSTILSDVKNPVGWITAWSTLVSLVYKICNMRGLGHVANKMCLSSTPHSLISSSIGLLLVFRTNSAYQRFKEGRETWENLLNICRDITRMTSVYERDIGIKTKQRIQRLLAAFPYLLHHHIQPRCLNHELCEEIRDTPHALILNEPRSIHRGQRKSKKTSKECWVDKRSLPWCLLPDSVLNKCAQSHNRPLWVADRLALEFTDIKYTDNWTSRERLALLNSASKMSDCIGHCERIHQTAVPLNYARHALRSLTLWSFTLPFGLIDKLGLMTGPAVGMVAWLMFGVYQIGHTIEDPFQGSLRLTDMCNSIYRDVMYGDRNEAGMRRESAFRKDGEKDNDWDSLGDAFGLGWTVQAKENMELYNEQLVLSP